MKIQPDVLHYENPNLSLHIELQEVIFVSFLCQLVFLLAGVYKTMIPAAGNCMFSSYIVSMNWKYKLN